MGMRRVRGLPLCTVPHPVINSCRFLWVGRVRRLEMVQRHPSDGWGGGIEFRYPLVLLHPSVRPKRPSEELIYSSRPAIPTFILSARAHTHNHTLSHTSSPPVRWLRGTF